MIENTNYNYIKCPFDKRFLIYRNQSLGLFNLCLPVENDYPIVVATIWDGDAGPMNNAHNLGWKINEEYQGQGLMRNFLNFFLNDCPLNGCCFAVKVRK